MDLYISFHSISFTSFSSIIVSLGWKSITRYIYMLHIISIFQLLKNLNNEYFVNVPLSEFIIFYTINNIINYKNI